MKLIFLISLLIAISCDEFPGIDVSKWDEDIDWPTVAQNNYFAIIRAGYGTGGSDEYFEANYAGAKAAGVKVGSYWYSYAESTDDAVNEAYSFIDALSGKQFEWPVYYDIEEQSIFDAGIASDIARAFCSVLEENRYYCGIYSSRCAFEDYFDDDVKTRYTIWLAEWDVPSPYYEGSYDVWQYGGGETPGVHDQCDLDTGYLDFEPIMKENHLNGY